MFSSDRLRNILWVLFWVLMPLEAWPLPAMPVKPVEIHLHAEVDVSGERVVLGDVATIYAARLEDFRALSELSLTQMPADRDELRLPSSYLGRRIQEALPAGTEFRLSAPAEIAFRKRGLGFTEKAFAEELLRLARAQGKIPAGVEAEVLPISGFDSLKLLSPAQSRIEPAAEMPRWKGDLSFRVVRTTKGDGPAPWVKVRVRWFQEAWVANRTLAYSQPLDAAAFSPRRIETTFLREEPVAAADAEELAAQLRNSKVRRTVVASSPLLPSQLERKPDASAGKSLRVVFTSESGVQVSADGALVNPATIGGEAKARLRSSRKIVTGRLVSEGVVEVSL